MCLPVVQHLPLLVGEELSLDVLRMMLSSGQLDASLAAAGLKLGARFKIEHGLRALLVDGRRRSDDCAVVGGAPRGGGADDAGDDAAEDAAAAAASAATSAAAEASSTTPQWYLDGNFEDIS